MARPAPFSCQTAQNDSQVQLARVSQELINFTIIFRQLYSMVTNKLGDGHEDLQTKRGGFLISDTSSN